LAVLLAGLLNTFVLQKNLGIVTGADGTVELMPDLVRIPVVAFTSWDRLPGRRYPTVPIPRLAPNLAVEVLSRSNTPGEMAVKRQDYFTAGVQLVWEIDPDKRTASVYTAPNAGTALGIADSLDGAMVLPGFRLPLRDLFAELDRHG
jgi:Uma2 family endonuclease